MIDTNQNHLDESLYDQFEYRLVYLRPNIHSEERLTVGIISTSDSGFDLRLLNRISAIALMAKIFGESGVEQFQFAASELRRTIRSVESWDSLVMPTSLLVMGRKANAFTCDRQGFLVSLLSSASSLVRSSTKREREVVTTSFRTKVSTELYNAVSLLDPLKADSLFHKKVVLENSGEIEQVELPILGNRIFGAPVSLSAATWDQKMRAEAYVAKFHWLQNFLPQQPKIYVLAPRCESTSIATKSDLCIRELRAVAEASSVRLGITESMSEMAAFVVEDEAVH